MNDMTRRRTQHVIAVLALTAASLAKGGETRAEIGCEASALNAAPISVSSMRGHFTVFESNRNPILPPEEKCYYVAPNVSYETRDGATPHVSLNDYGSFATVTVTLVFDYPEPGEIAAGLRRSDPNHEAVTTRNVARLAPRTIRVEHPVFQTKELVDPADTGGVAVASDAYTIVLETREGRARAARTFVDKFRQGEETLTVSYLIPTAEARLSSVDVSWRNIASSKGFAEFRQAAQDHVVVASQALDAGMDVARELKATLWQEYEDADATAFLDLTRQIAQSLLSGAMETFVDVEQLSRMLAPYQIDLHSANFQPDEIKSFVADVKNLSKTDFGGKYFRDYANAFRHEKNSDLGGGTHLNVFKIFGGGLNYNQKFHNLTDTELKEKLERENYFRQDLDRSYHVQMEGHIVRHLSIQAYENLNLAVQRTGQEDVVTYRVHSKPVWIPVAVASSEIRERTKWRNPPISLGGN